MSAFRMGPAAAQVDLGKVSIHLGKVGTFVLARFSRATEASRQSQPWPLHGLPQSRGWVCDPCDGRRLAPHKQLAVGFYRRHRSLPQSSSVSRFTAGASAFFILSQSGERPER